jgi:stress responsive alpha/beta barrel protein
MKTLIALSLTALIMTALNPSSPGADAPAGKTKLVHVVSFKFKDGTAPEKIAALEDAFRALKTQIPEVQSYEGGKNVSKEGKDKGFQHCSVLSFKSAQDLDTYIHSAAHQAFVKMLHDIVDDVFVVDFWE